MKLRTDQELRDQLLHQGYNVPMIVIRTWGGHGSHNGSHHNNRRVQVERWLRFMYREPMARTVLFPQFLFNFSIQFRRQAQRCQADIQQGRRRA